MTARELTRETTMAETTAPWQARLDRLTLADPVRFGGLCLYPLIGDDLGRAPYVLLDDALAAGLLTIEEKGAGGSVPELALTNAGRDRVLLLDGEELVGAKQNRIVNTTVLVEAQTTLTLPVTCVEAGRWRQESQRFASAGTHYNARGRQKKVAEVSASLQSSGRASADQGRVWEDVGAKLARMAVPSDSGALHAVSEHYGTSLDDFQRHLATPLAGQVGAAFALGRDLVGVDLFDRPGTLAALLPKLVASYALDALDEKTADAPPPVSVVESWLRGLTEATPSAHPAVGLGEDVRLSGPRLSGAALQYGGTSLHLSAFVTAPGEAALPGTVRPGRMVRASQRRRVE